MKTIYCKNFLGSLELKALNLNSAVTLGNFDGCHRAHREILSFTVEHAKKKYQQSVAFTFLPNPREFFSQGEKNRLFTLEQKLEAFDKLGFDLAVIQNFDESFSKVTHEDFYQKGLVETIKAKTLVSGENFCFGFQRKGTSFWLKEKGKKDAIEVFSFKNKNSKDNLPISSTQIRNFLKEGNIQKAEELLGHPYLVQGNIIQGKQLGRTLGFHTANFTNIQQMLPAKGVYLGLLKRLGAKESPWSLAISNVGTRPTVDHQDRTIKLEAHALENQSSFEEELYGETCLFSFHLHLRDEIKFSSLDKLKEQIKIDLNVAQSYKGKIIPALSLCGL